MSRAVTNTVRKIIGVPMILSMVTGRLTSFCSYHFVWQKEGT
jgi:uncharacterized membrane protein YoaK (UPF0700 family)